MTKNIPFPAMMSIRFGIQMPAIAVSMFACGPKAYVPLGASYKKQWEAGYKILNDKKNIEFVQSPKMTEFENYWLTLKREIRRELVTSSMESSTVRSA